MTRILIVDDEEKIRQMIRKYAEYEGFETDEAEDGLQAVEKCSINQYDLVVIHHAVCPRRRIRQGSRI